MAASWPRRLHGGREARCGCCAMSRPGRLPLARPVARRVQTRRAQTLATSYSAQTFRRRTWMSSSARAPVVDRLIRHTQRRSDLRERLACLDQIQHLATELRRVPPRHDETPSTRAAHHSGPPNGSSSRPLEAPAVLGVAAATLAFFRSAQPTNLMLTASARRRYRPRRGSRDDRRWAGSPSPGCRPGPGVPDLVARLDHAVADGGAQLARTARSPETQLGLAAHSPPDVRGIAVPGTRMILFDLPVG